MAPKLHHGVVMYGPDGKLYYVCRDEGGRRPKSMRVDECETAWLDLCRCLGIKSPRDVVLSGVMTRQDCKALSRRPVSRRSAKKRP